MKKKNNFNNSGDDIMFSSEFNYETNFISKLIIERNMKYLWKIRYWENSELTRNHQKWVVRLMYESFKTHFTEKMNPFNFIKIYIAD